MVPISQTVVLVGVFPVFAHLVPARRSCSRFQFLHQRGKLGTEPPSLTTSDAMPRCQSSLMVTSGQSTTDDYSPFGFCSGVEAQDMADKAPLPI